MRKLPLVGALIFAMLLLGACRITPALTALPDDLPAGTEEWAVNGHALRFPGAKVGFGPYHTAQVQGSGGASRWALTGRHLGFGKEARHYGFGLERENTPVLGVGCGNSLAFVRLKAGQVSADIGDLRDIPALACDIWAADALANATPLGTMTLWPNGWDIVGNMDAPSGPIDIASTRAIEGVGVPMGTPVAYRLSRNGRLLAHVDLLNRGAVRMVPGLADADRDWLAAAATALLIKVD